MRIIREEQELDRLLFREGMNKMKAIEQLSEATLKRRLKALYGLPELTQEQKDMRTKIEDRLWQLHVEKHPPVHTPANFIEKEEEW